VYALGAPVLPGMLAVGEKVKASGKNLLATLVAGYEVAARLGMAFTPRPSAHQNGQAMLLAAAAAGARLHGLDAAKLSLAMRIAAILMLTPSYTNTVAGATALNVAGGMAGFAGAFAPDLALAGFEAQPDAIEEALGNMVGAGFDTTHLTDELGTRWQLLPAACLLQPHPPRARRAASGTRRIEATRGRHRAHRVRHL
jgi:2-methylcitrate dehydratase PrpD